MSSPIKLILSIIIFMSVNSNCGFQVAQAKTFHLWLLSFSIYTSSASGSSLRSSSKYIIRFYFTNFTATILPWIIIISCLHYCNSFLTSLKTSIPPPQPTPPLSNIQPGESVKAQVRSCCFSTPVPAATPHFTQNKSLGLCVASQALYVFPTTTLNHTCPYFSLKKPSTLQPYITYTGCTLFLWYSFHRYLHE